MSGNASVLGRSVPLRPMFVLFSLLCVAVVSLWPGCATPGDASPKGDRVSSNAPVLRVGVSPNYPPVIFTLDKRFAAMGAELFPAGQKYHGLDAELAEELAAGLGMRLQFVEEKWENLIPALRERRIDIIMAGMSITPERAESVAFSSPYLHVGHLTLVRGADAVRYPSKEAIVGAHVRVAVIPETTADLLVQRSFPEATRVFAETPEAATRAVVIGEADLFIHDAPAIWWMAAVKKLDGVKVIPIPLTEEYLGWAVRQEDTTLLERVNTILAQWRSTGKLDEAVARWMPPTE